MVAALDGPLYALTRRRPDVLIPMMVRQGDVRSLLGFTHPVRARLHRDRLGPESVSAWQVTESAADDWRAKEELLRAAALAGCTRLELDPDLDLRAAQTLDLARAIAYAASHRRASACL